jgi:hypothetical protein
MKIPTIPHFKWLQVESMSARLKFPFDEIHYTDLVPGHTYYFQVTKNLIKKTNDKVVRKLSGIFQRIITFQRSTYAEFTNVKIHDKAARTLKYNSGKIENPFLNVGNIMKPIRNRRTRTLRNVKNPQHQNLNMKTFANKSWLFNVSKWKFGESQSEAAGKYLTEKLMAEKTGMNIPAMRGYFQNTDANIIFENRMKALNAIEEVNNEGNNNNTNRNNTV